MMLSQKKGATKYSPHIFYLFTLFFFMFPLASCTTKKSTLDQVTLALTQYPKSLDPRITTDATGQRLNQLIFDSLVKIGPDLNIIGDAAKSWSYKNKTYTFHLHKGLTFSDNSPLTKEDILFSFSEFMKPSSPFKSSFDLIEAVDVQETEEGMIVQIRLKKFSAVFLTDLTLIRLLPKKVVQKYGDNFNSHLMGTGAFKIDHISLNEIQLSTRPHPIYSPKIKKVLFKIIQDDSTRFLNAYKGSIDIIQSGLPLNKIHYIEKTGKYDIYKYPGPSMNYILINLRDKDLQNIHLRKSISEGINRSEIIKYKLEDFASSATSLLPKNNPFHNAELKEIPYQPQISKKWIQENGFLNKEFDLKTSNSPEVIEVARVIASQLGQIGIQVKIQSYEWGTFYGDIKNGDFQLAMMRWVGLSDPDIYRLAFHSKEIPPGRNRGYYTNKVLDKWLEDGISIENEKARKEHYNQIQKTVFDDQAIIPLWYNTLVDIVSKRIHNYRPPLNGDLSPLYEIEIRE